MGVSTLVNHRTLPAVPAPPPRRTMTEAEFVEWCSDKTRAEWVAGEVIEMSPASLEHNDVFGFLLTLLSMYVEEHNLGKAVGPEFQVRFPDQHSRRVPDILFVAKEHLAQAEARHLEGPPDLIVEIVSPDSTARDYRDKYHEYAAAAVKEYWIVDPLAKRLEVHALAGRKRYRVIPETKGAVRSRVLPGFFIKPAWLWQAPRPKLRAVLRELGIT